MKVKDLLPVVDRDIDSNDSVEFYCGKEKIGYFNDCELVADIPLKRLLESDVEIISGGVDKQSIRIFITNN